MKATAPAMTPTPSPLLTPLRFGCSSGDIKDATGDVIAIVFGRDFDHEQSRLALIVQAVNERAGLLALLKQCVEIIDELHAPSVPPAAAAALNQAEK